MGLFRWSSALLVALLASSSSSTNAASIGGGPSAVLVDGATGTASRSPPGGSVPSTSGGVIAVVGEPSSLGLDDSSAADGSVTAFSGGGGDGGGPAVLTAGGSGASVGAASSSAGAVVVTGETSGDVERGLGDSGAGRTLSAVFSAKLSLAAAAAADEEEGERTLLIFAVSPEGIDAIDEEATLTGVRAVFDAEAAAAGRDAALEDLYEVRVAGVSSEEDAQKVLEEASAAASRSPLSSPDAPPVSSAVFDSYSKLSSSPSDDSPAIAAAVLACDSASSRCRRSSRARLAGWKSRAARGLSVDRFGKEASALLDRTLASYDRDTSVAAGLSSSPAPAYRLEVRSKLRARLESSVGELFELQASHLRRKTLKSFDAALIRATRSAERMDDAPHAGDERAIARRTALFAFDASLGELEVPSLGLTKSKALAEMAGALNDALTSFEDNPSAKLKAVKEVQKKAAKERKPGERSVDAKIDLVAMIRPDGFGNLQGFVGYQTPWGSQVTVGFQNDADSPEVIGQFGGVRPPFLRVQPKLKLDIEL
eukprot:CAMPEP_0113540530 /NCGR_PEP_ID=MMETSP0015_2-20120614/8529_1 /TAXON_ID=2838 /ORGANISM="Odontella" /LENGTH=539 /DNA_ID=CAMNT_0000440339 /DNA_START=187 /DNA_END=1806 /DNA_ORIENTATION=- /assembly_acc=CAM_ASM_000160